jgi:enoyl-CoA hydratase
MAEESNGRVLSEVKDHILRITISNPSKRNAFDPEMMLELSNALTELDVNPELWVGVLTAEGEHFTAGLDMPKFFGPGANPTSIPEDNVSVFGLGKTCSKPIVTAMQGISFTIGIEMALAGDIIIAADDCRFCQMEAKRGIAPLGGAHFRYVSRSGWGNAMYHLMLCDEFGAEEAYRVGLVQEVVAAGTQIDRAMEIANIISQNAPLGIQATKAAGRKYIEAGEASAVNAIDDIRAKVMSSQDAAEGIQSFVERRAAVFTGR